MAITMIVSMEGGADPSWSSKKIVFKFCSPKSRSLETQWWHHRAKLRFLFIIIIFWQLFKGFLHLWWVFFKFQQSLKENKNFSYSLLQGWKIVRLYHLKESLWQNSKLNAIMMRVGKKISKFKLNPVKLVRFHAHLF